MAQPQPTPEGQEPTRLRRERWTDAGPIRTIESRDRVQALETNAAATVAEAAALGLAGFASGNFTLSAVNAGWAPVPAAYVVAAPVVLVFAGLTQFIAGMWSFRKGDTFGATTFGTFGAFNALFVLGVYLVGIGAITLGTPSFSVTAGVTVAMFALISAYLAFAAVSRSLVLVGVLAFLAAELALLSAGFFATGGSYNLSIMAAGYTGLISSLLAFYASAAIVINSTAQRSVLPF